MLTPPSNQPLPPPPFFTLPTGKVIDIAIAFVVGAAFTDLIKTFVSSFVTPLLAAIGSRSFSQLFFTVRGQKIAYGERRVFQLFSSLSREREKILEMERKREVILETETERERKEKEREMKKREK